MTSRYHVTVDHQGDPWRAVCPALMDHGAVTGGETCEEFLTHIENVIAMILVEMESGGMSPPPDEPVSGGNLVTIRQDIGLGKTSLAYRKPWP